MKNILIFLLITLSNFALGSSELISKAIKANDIQALESILNNTEPNENLKDSWESIIEEAIKSSPNAIQPLLKFGYEHEFHLAPSYYEQLENGLSILKLNDKNLSSFTIKYYADVITKNELWCNLESLPIESLNLLLDNGLSIERYTSIIKSKLMELLEKNNTEAIQSLIELIKNKNLKVISDTSDILAIISYANDATAAFFIENYPHFIQTLNDDRDTYWTIYTLKSISQERLNLLLSHGLKIDLYINIIFEKIHILSIDNNASKLRELLTKINFNEEDTEIWSSIIENEYYYYSPECTAELLSFLYPKKIQLNINNYDFINILEKCDTNIASMLIKSYPEYVKQISCYNTHTPICRDNLNLLLLNGLKPETYACYFCKEIENLSINNDPEYIKSLLENTPPTDTYKETIKLTITKLISLNIPLETYKTIIEFAIEKGVEVISNKDDLIKAIKSSNEETATFLIEKYPHIVKTIQSYPNDHQIRYDLSLISSNTLNLLSKNGLDIKLYTSIIGTKITNAIHNKNNELAQSLLNAFEITEANKHAWTDVLQQWILYPSIHHTPELVLPILQLGERHKLESLINDYYLGQLIKNCDEETATFAITHYPGIVPRTGYQLFYSPSQTYDPKTRDYVTMPPISLIKGLSTNLLTLLFDYDCKQLLIHLTAFDNGLKALELLLQKNPTLIIQHSEFEDFIEQTIIHQHFDILKLLSQYEIKLETIIKTNPDIEIRGLIGAAVASTERGTTDMLNHVLNTLNAHHHPAALATAASLHNGTLFNNFLEKGYSADPNSASEVNLWGLMFATASGNQQATRYFLEQGVDPNSAFDKLGGFYVILTNDSLLDNYSLNSERPEIPMTQKIETLDILIAHGLKISNLDIASSAQAGSLDLIKYFKEKGYNTRHPGIFVAACSSSNIELIDFLLDDSANINDPSALVSAVRGDNQRGDLPKIVQHLVEKGANPNNLMALNEALKTPNSELKIAKYLVEQGAKLEPRCIISAGLSGNQAALRWTLEQTKTTLTAELEAVINSSPEEIIKYTLKNLLPKESVLIGISNHGYHFTDGIGAVASNLMDQNSDVFIVPLTEELVSDDSIMIKFSGFINPGAGDSYPKLPEFSLKDMNEDKMENHELLYQRIISFAKKHDIPYLGICLGSQYLVLNNAGFLQPVEDHGGSITIHFEKGSIPHFMTLLPHEKAMALQECQLEDISIKNADVAHNFAAVKTKLGHNVKLGAISAKDTNVPESVSYGRNLIGVQFHPERGYFEDEEGTVNRQKTLLDNFFDNSLNHQKSRTYALQYGLHYTEVKDLIYNANQKLINHLEACAKNPEYRNNDHFWGKDLGSFDIPSDAPQNGSVNILTGLTPQDVALARDGDDLILIIKTTGDMLNINAHFAADSDHRVKSIDFADGSRLILNNDSDIQDGFSTLMESQANFNRNATSLN